MNVPRTERNTKPKCRKRPGFLEAQSEGWSIGQDHRGGLAEGSDVLFDGAIALTHRIEGQVPGPDLAPTVDLCFDRLGSVVPDRHSTLEWDRGPAVLFGALGDDPDDLV